MERKKKYMPTRKKWGIHIRKAGLKRRTEKEVQESEKKRKINK
jgi:hypothetical protein